MEKFERKVLPLSKIKANQQNPRFISESKLKKLINSLLVFPQMMSLRPITLDDNNIVLGGNMRQTALGRIAQMTPEELHSHIESLPEYKELPEPKQSEVMKFWNNFLNKPQAEVQYARSMTESEKKQFIIKDNVSFGDWDYDELENWDSARLENWGVDTQIPDFGVRDSPFDANRGEDVNPDDYGEDFTLPEGDHTDFRRYGFMLHDSQYERALIALKMAKADEGFKAYCDAQQNTNENGNALSYIFQQWVEQKKL